MKYEEEIRSFIETECEDYFLGVVDLSQVDNTLAEKYNSLIEEYPRAISVGITLPYMDKQLKADKKLRRQTNCQLKYITSQLSRLIENEGYQALAMPKSSNKSYQITFHETVAYLSDMGKLEKGYLITPEAGSKVNWGTVLTNAPL